jgi:hypothetical protein
VEDAHALVAEPAVAAPEALDGAHTAEHEVAERTRGELLIRLEQDDLDRRTA